MSKQTHIIEGRSVNFVFPLEEERRFRTFLLLLKRTPLHHWPVRDQWLSFKGLPWYSCYKDIKPDTGKVFLVVHFYGRVMLSSRKIGSVFYVGNKEKNAFPNCTKFQ